MAASASRAGLMAETAPGVEAALDRVQALGLEMPPRVLITGSLYLAGQVLALNGTPPVDGDDRDEPGHDQQIRFSRVRSDRAWIHLTILGLGTAPIWREAIWPFLKIISVGIDMMPYLDAVCGFSSTLSFTILSLPCSSVATSSSDGRDHSARPAPFGPEIDEHGIRGLEHVRVERRIGNLGDGHGIPR